jgi:hypothetical protein
VNTNGKSSAAVSEAMLPTVVPLTGEKTNLPDRVVSEHLNFTDQIERGLELLADQKLPRAELARRSLQILRRIVKYETGLSSLKDGLARFEAKLCAEPAARTLIANLLYCVSSDLRGSQVSNSDGEAEEEEVVDAFSQPITLRTLQDLIQWYSRRSTSLLAIEMERNRRGARLQSFDGDMLFGLELLHDREYCGMRGFEILSGVRLVGHNDEQLWIKIFVRQAGRYLRARGDWSLWTDVGALSGIDGAFDTMPAVGTNGTSAQHTDLEERKLAAIVPLKPDRQRVVVDSVRAFLPYEALDLPEGDSDLEIEVCLFNQQGDELQQEVLIESIHQPTRLAAAPRARPVPSPQYLGVWPDDAIRGDNISNARVVHLRRKFGEQVVPIIRVTFDIELYGKDLLPDEAGLKVECRILDGAGRGVATELEEVASSDGSLLMHFDLYPFEPIQRYHMLQFDIPVQALSVEEGIHRLFCELTVLQPDGRVLCGILEKFRLMSKNGQRGWTKNDTLPCKFIPETDRGVRLIKPPAGDAHLNGNLNGAKSAVEVLAKKPALNGTHPTAPANDNDILVKSRPDVAVTSPTLNTEPKKRAWFVRFWDWFCNG